MGATHVVNLDESGVSFKYMKEKSLRKGVDRKKTTTVLICTYEGKYGTCDGNCGASGSNSARDGHTRRRWHKQRVVEARKWCAQTVYARSETLKKRALRAAARVAFVK